MPGWLVRFGLFFLYTSRKKLSSHLDGALTLLVDPGIEITSPGMLVLCAAKIA